MRERIHAPYMPLGSALTLPLCLHSHKSSNVSSRSRAKGSDIEDDRRSVSSRRSSRAMSLLRRGSRQTSAEPQSSEKDSGTAAKRRSMSQRMPSFGRKSGAAAAAKRSATDDEAEEEPEVPPVPDLPEHPVTRQASNGGESQTGSRASSITGARTGGRLTSWNKGGSLRTIDNGPAPIVAEGSTAVGEATSKAMASRRVPVKRSPSEQSAPSQPQQQQQQGYLGAAVGAVAGAGAAAAAGAAAVASKVVGTGQQQQKNGQQHDGNDSDDSEEFHDAELADIAEHSEDGDHHGQSRGGRHRGLSESNAAGLTGRGGRNGGRSDSPDSSYAASTAPSQLRGTANSKRRSGSQPVGGDDTSTPTDAKAKKETPIYVREKAARVARLTYDDVKMEADEMEDDIQVARGALHLFLNSRMLEAEDIMKRHSDRKLYYALGDALIAVIKGFMVSIRASHVKARQLTNAFPS